VPLVPGYLSYMTGLSGRTSPRRAPARADASWLGSLLFVVGFAIPFTMLGFAVGTLNFLDRSPVARVVMGGIVARPRPADGPWTAHARAAGGRPGADRRPRVGPGTRVRVRGRVDAVPRAGGRCDPHPVDGSVTEGVSLRGAFLGFVYALGLGLPFILFGLLFRRLSGTLDVLKRNARTLQVVGGGLLVAVGLAIATGLWDRFIFAAAAVDPGLRATDLMGPARSVPCPP
jgi:cytochrome c-type biogenesis protein